MINKLCIISDMNDKTILKWASKTCQQNIFKVVVSASFLYNICLNKKKKIQCLMVSCRKIDSLFSLILHFSLWASINTEFNNSVLCSDSLPAVQTQSHCGWIKCPPLVQSDSLRRLSTRGVTTVLLSCILCMCECIQIVASYSGHFFMTWCRHKCKLLPWH